MNFIEHTELARIAMLLDRYRFTPPIAVPVTSPETISSTRRFFCLPDAVSFGATGMEKPRPTLVIEASGMPSIIRYCLTESDRYSESFWLISSEPTLSVCP